MFEELSNSDCINAKPYYYDFMDGESIDNIPSDIVEHINHCNYCRSEAHRLKILFSDTNTVDYEQYIKDSAVVGLLKLHFSLIDKQVKCSDVKLFLASLADPALVIRPSTPVKDHIQKCCSCRKDLDNLLALRLTHRQLCRLGKVLNIQTNTDEIVTCEYAQYSITAFIDGSFIEMEPAVLNHLSSCPACRETVYRERQKIIDKLAQNNYPDKSIEFEQVSYREVFDLCMPYDMDYEEFEDSEYFVSALQNNYAYLQKVQELHQILDTIIQIPATETATMFAYKEADITNIADKGIPLEIRAISNNTLKPAENTSAVKLSQTPAYRTKILRFAKPLVVAAIFLVGAFSLFYTPSAKGITLEQIYQALEKIQNVHIIRLTADSTTPYQEDWISKSLNILIRTIPQENQIVLYDISNNSMITKNLTTNSIENVIQSENILDRVGNQIQQAFGLVPFTELIQSKEYDWQVVGDTRNEISEPNIEIYELSLFTGKATPSKYLIYVNKITQLPYKIEFYSKSNTQDDFQLKSIEQAFYPKESEIKLLIQGTFNIL